MIRLALGVAALMVACLVALRAAGTPLALPLALLAFAAAVYIVFRYDPPRGAR